MPLTMIKDEIDKSGLRIFLKEIDLEDFLDKIEELNVDDALTDGSLYRFLESIVKVGSVPATWQKLSEMGWTDDEISSLLAVDLLSTVPTTLKAAIGSGALSIDEFNEYGNYPNQEVDILYYGEPARNIYSWLMKQIAIPKIREESFSS